MRRVAKTFAFAPGTFLVIDRGDVDYTRFAILTLSGVSFVTRLKESSGRSGPAATACSMCCFNRLRWYCSTLTGNHRRKRHAACCVSSE